MTGEAKITNRTSITIYAEGYPLLPGDTNTIPFKLSKLSIVSNIGYVVLDEDERKSPDCNSRLRAEKTEGFGSYDIIAK